LPTGLAVGSVLGVPPFEAFSSPRQPDVPILADPHDVSCNQSRSSHRGRRARPIHRPPSGYSPSESPLPFHVEARPTERPDAPLGFTFLGVMSDDLGPPFSGPPLACLFAIDVTIDRDAAPQSIDRSSPGSAIPNSPFKVSRLWSTLAFRISNAPGYVFTSQVGRSLGRLKHCDEERPDTYRGCQGR
jgi:hypothetical protein